MMSMNNNTGIRISRMTVLRLLLLLAICLKGFILPAQQAVLPSGDTGTGIGGSISFSIGQVDYFQAPGSPSGHFHAGVQQPYLPPDARCKDGEVSLGSSGNLLLSTDVPNDSSFAESGIAAMSVSPALFDCDDIDALHVVTLSVSDFNGFIASCDANIFVEEGSDLPSPWTHEQIGGFTGDSEFSICTDDGGFALTSTGFTFGTMDIEQFASQTLCGNSSIIAKVISVSGGGWAGVEMRETTASGSKKAVLKSQLSSILKREVRTATNGLVQSQTLMAPNRPWLRLDRTGNTFKAYHSTNGVNWNLAFSVQIVMANCIEVGLLAESINSSTLSKVVYNDIQISGGILPLPEASGNSYAHDLSQKDFLVFPNPASDELFLDLSLYSGQPVRIELFSTHGQLLQFFERAEVASGLIEQVDLSGYLSGMYFVKVRSNGLPDVTKRVVLQQSHYLRP
jgi:hypothetical protein